MFLSCHPDLESIGIVEEVKLGEHIVRLNGLDVGIDYPPFLTSSHGRVNIAFFQILNAGYESRTIGFSFVPLKKGTYRLTTERDLNGSVPASRALVTFSHIIEEDLIGYKYEYVPDDIKNFITISEVDTKAKTIKGEGRASFVLFDKQGWSGFDLPDEILYECKFHLAY